jgi:hypothetical protein
MSGVSSLYVLKKLLTAMSGAFAFVSISRGRPRQTRAKPAVLRWHWWRGYILEVSQGVI